MEFYHFIITRFNVNITEQDFPKRLEDMWLSIRFDLFQKYCFPTLAAQLNKNFKWLVLFDEQTPKRYLALINAYSRLDNFVPLFCADHSTILPTTITKMKEIAPAVDWYLTTRLDNDDALATEYVHCVQEIVKSMGEKPLQAENRYWLNLPNGLQFYQGEFYDFEDPCNAFLTYVESSDNPRTVFYKDHPQIFGHGPVIQAQTSPLWLQNVHDINVYNYLRGEKSAQQDWYTRFACQFDALPDS